MPCILLVDDDAGNSYETYYTAALDALGLDYALWSTSGGSPTLADMVDYTMVLWFTGNDYSTTISSTEEADLAAYLNQGGNFFLSSQDYLYDVGGSTTFDTTYLQIQSFTSDVNKNNPVGVAGDPIGDGLGAYTLTAPSGFGTLYTDNVVKTATAGVTNPFKWNDIANFNSTSYDSGTFKTVFLAWPIEGLSALADRQAVLGAVVDFFGGCTTCEPITNADFTWLPIDPAAGEAVAFTSTIATGDGTITYSWDFGDGSTSDVQNPTHTFADGGDFTVVFIASNTCSNSNRTEIVSVIPFVKIFLPTILR